MGNLATFSFPQGLCLDAAGNFYVADTLNNVIRQIQPGGRVTTFAGTGVAGSQLGPSADLATWSTLTNGVPGDGSSITFTDPAPVHSTPKQFYRVYVDF